jgi:hypothetical protein
MHDVELVLFAIPNMLTAFARSATPRDRDAHTLAKHHHERLGWKMQRPEEELCLPREPGSQMDSAMHGGG